MKKRILSLVFAVLLCVSLVPMNVIAEGLEPLDPGLLYGYNIYTQIDGEGYLSFSSDRGVFAGQMVNVYANGKLCFDGDGNPLYSYELRELQVTDANGNKVYMYKGTSGPDSFIMPACDVTVKAVFRAPGDPTYTYAVVLEQDGVVDVTMTAGNTYKLGVTVAPFNASQSVKWKSSNPNVASVDSRGVVVAKKAGTATITATAENGKKAVCKVTVNKKPSALKTILKSLFKK